VIPGFMIQGGDPTASGSGGPGYSFKDELPSASSAYGTGAVAMANSGANTNGSQFFVVVPGGGAQLSPSYSVFGQVTSGMNIVEKINSDGTSAGNPQRVPQDRQGDHHGVLTGSNAFAAAYPHLSHRAALEEERHAQPLSRRRRLQRQAAAVRWPASHVHRPGETVFG
jgi:cyclophilin family peptidyl-prolyl cis-trans isomerase